MVTGTKLGHLVPCCGACNSAKGSTDWVTYLEKAKQPGLEARGKVIAAYAAKYAVVIDPKVAATLLPDDWKRYVEIREKILSLMKEADKIAAGLQDAVLAHGQQAHNAAIKV